MALFNVCGPPFTYRGGTSGLEVRVAPAHPAVDANLFDTNDPRRDLPAGWQPPLLGLRAMDADAKAMVDAVRAPLAGTGDGQYVTGVGYVPRDEPIWVP